MKAKELDRRFDRGEGITGSLDLGGARRPGLEQRRVNVDFPSWRSTPWTTRRRGWG